MFFFSLRFVLCSRYLFILLALEQLQKSIEGGFEAHLIFYDDTSRSKSFSSCLVWYFSEGVWVKCFLLLFFSSIRFINFYEVPRYCLPGCRQAFVCYRKLLLRCHTFMLLHVLVIQRRQWLLWFVVKRNSLV